MPPDPATVPVGSRHALPTALSLGPPFPGQFVLSDSDGQRVQPARPPRRLLRSTSPSSRLFCAHGWYLPLLPTTEYAYEQLEPRVLRRLSAREGEVGHAAGTAHRLDREPALESL